MLFRSGNVVGEGRRDVGGARGLRQTGSHSGLQLVAVTEVPGNAVPGVMNLCSAALRWLPCVVWLKPFISSLVAYEPNIKVGQSIDFLVAHIFIAAS